MPRAPVFTGLKVAGHSHGQILTIPWIVEARSTFAIRTMLSRGPLPLDHSRKPPGRRY